MGFSSAGVGCGCSFYFELPLYSKPVLPGLPSLIIAIDEMNPSLTQRGPRLRAIGTPPHLRSPNTPPSLNMHIVSIAEEKTRRPSLKVLTDGFAFQFLADKHGSQSENKGDSPSILFDHVFQQMLTPPLHFSNYSKGGNPSHLLI